MCLNIGTPKAINFPFDTNGKVMFLYVSVLKHFQVCHVIQKSTTCMFIWSSSQAITPLQISAESNHKH